MLQCPCHPVEFTTSGEPADVYGDAKPLQRYPVKVEGGEVFVLGT
jgi:nitrite reductase/ring-hydroxylating ferredoxin subunit